MVEKISVLYGVKYTKKNGRILLIFVKGRDSRSSRSQHFVAFGVCADGHR